MNKEHKDLILAAEISGFLHDLGKLCPEFAAEGMKGGENLSDKVKEYGFAAAHGAILEQDKRAYPEQNEHSWLNEIKTHTGWQSVLELPSEWIVAKTIQVQGLGGPLRQHHANGKFSPSEFSLLGDIYTFGADIRDSALDKSSGGTASGKQPLSSGFMADGFGLDQGKYSPDTLSCVWKNIASLLPGLLFNTTTEPWKHVEKTRQNLYDSLQSDYKNALGETRRPTNDVTLWHHCLSTASLFKASVAEGVLQQTFTHLQGSDGLLDFKQLGRMRFRLFSVRWDWSALTQGALKPVLYSALASKKTEVIAGLKQLLEIDYPVGNCIYQDDNGAVFVVPAFYSGGAEQEQEASCQLFMKHIIDALKNSILNKIVPLGAGTSIRLAWTQPALYLTDYPQVLSVKAIGSNELMLQVGLDALKADWAKKTGQVQICPQCGLRPAVARELEVYQSGLDDEDKIPQGWCLHCESLADDSSREQRRKEAEQSFAFQPETFNLQKIRQHRNQGKDNARVVLISVQVDAKRIASGEAFVTQLARPLADVELKKNLKSAEAAGDFLNSIWTLIGSEDSEDDLRKKISKKEVGHVRKILGDTYWLDFYAEKNDEIDGRSLNKCSGGKCIEIAKNFFLKEAIPEGLGLCRHTGDRLLLFGLRKHASPGRLARTWDDFTALWKDTLADIAEFTQNYAMPISLDAQGFRVIVAAEDSRQVLQAIQQKVGTRLQKVRGGIAPQISALVFKDKFPLYVAMDALRRMEQRPLLRQEWSVRTVQKKGAAIIIDWQTPQGEVNWNVDISTGDPDQLDIWHPHVICSSQPEGIGRIVALQALNVGDKVNIPVADFDFSVLDGTARRYELAYDAQGKRSHFILGATGRPSYLWEQMPYLLKTLPEMIVGWNSSQAKAILGQVVECYEKWVRDVPKSLVIEGREAWHIHVRAILARSKLTLNAEEINLVINGLDNGQFFDAFEWAGFIEKTKSSNSKQG